MSVKGSSGSHTLSSPAQLPPNLAAWTLSFAHRGPFLLLHLFSLLCLPAQMAAGVSPSALLGDGLVTEDVGLCSVGAGCDAAVSSDGLTDLEL